MNACQTGCIISIVCDCNVLSDSEKIKLESQQTRLPCETEKLNHWLSNGEVSQRDGGEMWKI